MDKGEDPASTEVDLEKQLLQDALDMERALSSKLMRIILSERVTVSHLYGLLSDKNPKYRSGMLPKTNEDMEKIICPGCKANKE